MDRIQIKYYNNHALLLHCAICIYIGYNDFMRIINYFYT